MAIIGIVRPEGKANVRVIGPPREELKSRGLRVSKGIPVVIDGSKGAFGLMGWACRTHDCLASINSMAEHRCGKVKSWKNTSQKRRCLASALLDIEPRLKCIRGHKELPELLAAVKCELKL